MRSGLGSRASETASAQGRVVRPSLVWQCGDSPRIPEEAGTREEAGGESGDSPRMACANRAKKAK
jgi:hypothetical protein